MNGKSIYEIELGEYSEKSDCITIEKAYKYADVTGDHNPLHFETETAHQSRYQRPIAHGMILPGLISGVIGTYLPGEGCIYVSQTLNFLRPVFYGDNVVTRVSVSAIDIDRNRVTLLTECRNQDGEVVLTGEAIVIPRKDESHAIH